MGANLLPSLSCHRGVSRVNIRAGSLVASLAISSHASRVFIRASCTIAGSSCHRVAWVDQVGHVATRGLKEALQCDLLITIGGAPCCDPQWSRTVEKDLFVFHIQAGYEVPETSQA